MSLICHQCKTTKSTTAIFARYLAKISILRAVFFKFYRFFAFVYYFSAFGKLSLFNVQDKSSKILTQTVHCIIKVMSLEK